MRILHTADWHLGRKFLGKSCEDEEILFIEYFLGLIKTKNVDVVLISGDVFDNPNPPITAEKNYFYFLKKVVDIGCDVIITSGNHDSKKKLNASYQLLENSGSIFVETKGSVIQPRNFSNVSISAVPFLTMDDLQINPCSKTYSDIEKETRLKIKEVYKNLQGKSDINIGMGHFSILGFSMNEFKGVITSSDYGAMSSKDLKGFDYLAMGHLHKSQHNEDNVVYSGSPFACNFGEHSNIRSIVVVNVEKGKSLDYEFLSIPKFRDVVVFRGSSEKIMSQISEYSMDSELGCFGSLVFDEELSDAQTKDVLLFAGERGIEVLKYSLQKIDLKKNTDVSFALEQTPKEIFLSLVDKSDKLEFGGNKDMLSRYFDIVVDWQGEQTS